MTLTVVVGSSGSGKTTFLNDVHKSHRCIYIRQYHAARPYIPVTAIPKFDPTELPFWNIYVEEGTAESIKIGGTMAGEFTAGFSGGQRKLLLFELIRQRVAHQSELLIVLDEPFAGVTDDFVPFITKRLQEIREKHNILLVTNDHVQVLMDMADNVITVSAVDRSIVKINDREAVDREKAIVALSVGEPYPYSAGKDDLWFFFQVEVLSNAGLVTILVFSFVFYGLMLLTYWDSSMESVALVIIAGDIVSYFSLNPYLLASVDWRNFMIEESEALMHASVPMNRMLRTCLCIIFMFIISTVDFGIINAALDSGLSEFKYWVAILFDSASTTLPFVCSGLYTSLGQQDAEIMGSFPFLLMIFFSTAFSPGSGVAGVKELRYLFPRFYFWCMIDELEPSMEGCPDNNLLLYLVLSAFVFVFVFVTVKIILHFMEVAEEKEKDKLKESRKDNEFKSLQSEMYGSGGMQKSLRHLHSTSHSDEELHGKDEEH